MNGQPLLVLPQVEGDLAYAYDFYQSWRTDGEEVFRGRLLEIRSKIESNPLMFPTKYRTFRRAIIRKTFFAVFYVVDPGVTVVVGVLDMRRDPRVVRRIITGRRRSSRS